MNKWWWWRWRWRETTTVWNVKGRRSKGVSDSGGATPGRARSNDLAGTSTALAPSLAPPCLLLCFGNSVNTKYKFYHIWPLTALFVLFWQWNSLRSSTFFQEKVHPDDLARGCSDLEKTWLLCCAGADTGQRRPMNAPIPVSSRRRTKRSLCDWRSECRQWRWCLRRERTLDGRVWANRTRSHAGTDTNTAGPRRPPAHSPVHAVCTLWRVMPYNIACQPSPFWQDIHFLAFLTHRPP